MTLALALTLTLILNASQVALQIAAALREGAPLDARAQDNLRFWCGVLGLLGVGISLPDPDPKPLTLS